MDENDPVKEQLLASDEEFRSLYDEHQQYKARLEEYRHKTLTSEEDEIEMKRIKVHKLHLKDQMEARLREHQQHAVA
ncbi:MAG: DUF465 domain-containing protein [Acidobacteriota bacterium]